MRIEHYKRTSIARAPDEIVRATNEFTTHHAFLNKDSKPDIYHFHNKRKPGLDYKPNQIIQYHSDPGGVDMTFPGTRLTLAQYHCLLPEYRDCKVVRNIIPIHDPIYTPSYIDLDIIRVGFSPSRTNPQNIKGRFDKGYQVTKIILEKVKNAFPKRFEYDIITNTKPVPCMKRKNQCNVVIDEVVTESYHKCTLEGLATGKATICSMSEGMEAVLKRYAPWLPVLNVWAKDLEAYLVNMIESHTDVLKIGIASRQWMEQYWRPDDIINNDFIPIYEEIRRR